MFYYFQYNHRIYFSKNLILKTIDYCTWCQKWDSMAMFRLQPPVPFSFKSPDEWPMAQVENSSELHLVLMRRLGRSKLVCYGENAGDTLASVIKKFDDFFKVRKNIILEHAQFNKRCQGSGESIKQFITSLYSLADG